MGAYVIFSGRVTAAEHSAILSTPIMLGYQLTHIACSVTAIIFVLKTLKHYDPSEEGHRKFSRAWRIMNFGQIVFLIASGVLYGIFYNLGSRSIGITSVHMPSYTLIWLGATLMWDMFFFIPWLELTEKWLYFVPFQQGQHGPYASP